MKINVQRTIILFIFIALSSILITSCDKITPPKQATSESLNDEEKERLLRARVMEFWNAKVNNDKDKLYELYDPFFKNKISKDHFKGMGVNLIYENPSIVSLTIEGNVATAKVSFTYSGEILGKLSPVKLEKTTAVAEQTWVFMDGNWYLQYIDNITEGTFLRF